MPRRVRRPTTEPSVNLEAEQILDEFLRAHLSGTHGRSKLRVIEEDADVPPALPDKQHSVTYGPSDDIDGVVSLNERTGSYPIVSLASTESLNDIVTGQREPDIRPKCNSLPSNYMRTIQVVDKADIPKDIVAEYLTHPKPQTEPISSSSSSIDSWVHKGRKKKNFFTRAKERLLYAFRLTEQKQRDSEEEAAVEQKQKKKRLKKKKRKTKNQKVKNGDGRSNSSKSSHSVTVSTGAKSGRSITPSMNGDLTSVTSRQRDVRRSLNASEKEMLLRAKEKSPSTSGAGFAGIVRDKLLGPIRKSLKRRKSKTDIKGSKSDEPLSSSRIKPTAPIRTISDPAHVHHAVNTNTGSPRFYGTNHSVPVEIRSNPCTNDVSTGTATAPSIRDSERDEVLAVDVHHRTRSDADSGTAEVLDLFAHCMHADGDHLPCTVHADGDTDDVDHRPLSEKTAEEKNHIYEVIADRLAALAASYMAKTDPDSTQSDSSTSKGKQSPASSSSEHREFSRLTSLEEKLTMCLRQHGDQISENSSFPMEAVNQVAKNAAYSTFKTKVQESIGSEQGWNQVAMLFSLTKAAVKVAGASGSMANSLKDNALRYFEDKFAGWVVGQGGWDSMLEDTDTADSELDID